MGEWWKCCHLLVHLDRSCRGRSDCWSAGRKSDDAFGRNQFGGMTRLPVVYLWKSYGDDSGLYGCGGMVRNFGAGTRAMGRVGFEKGGSGNMTVSRSDCGYGRENSGTVGSRRFVLYVGDLVEQDGMTNGGVNWYGCELQQG